MPDNGELECVIRRTGVRISPLPYSGRADGYAPGSDQMGRHPQKGSDRDPNYRARWAAHAFNTRGIDNALCAATPPRETVKEVIL